MDGLGLVGEQMWRGHESSTLYIQVHMLKYEKVWTFIWSTFLFTWRFRSIYQCHNNLWYYCNFLCWDTLGILTFVNDPHDCDSRCPFEGPVTSYFYSSSHTLVLLIIMVRLGSDEASLSAINSAADVYSPQRSHQGQTLIREGTVLVTGAWQT